MRNIKTAVIGCGKVGHFHAKCLASSPYSTLTAVCDHDPKRAAAFAAEYGAAAYTSAGDMIRDCGIEAVSICTPHPIHADAAVEAISAGAHVLIEKPLASSLADCDRILSAAEQAGVRVGVACQRRFYTPCLRLRRALDEGKLGRPILGDVTMLGWRGEEYYASDPWRGTWQGEGGGVMVNQAPHQMDLLLWYMGEIDELYGMWDTLNHPGLEVEDTAAAVIRFKSGALGTLTVSNSQNPALYGKVRVHGENGATAGVQTDGGMMFIAGMSGIVEPPYNDLWTIPGEAELLEAWKRQDSEEFGSHPEPHYYHGLLIDDFLDALITGREPLVTGRDGRRVVELFTAIYRSRRDGKPQKFPLSAADDAYYDGRQIHVQEQY